MSTLNVDLLGKVIAQMQGLIDTPPNPENETELAMHGLVTSWHAMLLSALVDEVKAHG